MSSNERRLQSGRWLEVFGQFESKQGARTNNWKSDPLGQDGLTSLLGNQNPGPSAGKEFVTLAPLGRQGSPGPGPHSAAVHFPTGASQWQSFL